MSKEIVEKKLPVTIKKYFYENSIPPHLTPDKVFVIAEILVSLWLWNFQTSSLFLLIMLWKIKRNCMSGYFILHIC